MSASQKRDLAHIFVSVATFLTVLGLDKSGALGAWFGPNALLAAFFLYLIPYLIAGYEVIFNALRNIVRGGFLDEDFLMFVATVGAFALVAFPDSDPHMTEGAAVMIFFQIGEFFEEYAVDKSRKSIASMMDIAPDYANVERAGALVQVDPDEVAVDDVIVVKPGERIPLDGEVVEGATQVNTSALTGESLPVIAEVGDAVTSGCVNMTGLIRVRVTKPFGESTVSRILELVENASERKARAENFITRFARYYTPIVVGCAAALAIIPPLLGMGAWFDWIERGLIFLVVSCPCALVISVPLSFFGGIGGASRLGILIKGGNYLEALSKVDTVVFDKTGTLTKGSFEVTGIHPAAMADKTTTSQAAGAGEAASAQVPGTEKATGARAEGDAASAASAPMGTSGEAAPTALLDLAAHLEGYSDHPIALGVRHAFGGQPDMSRVSDVEEVGGHGVVALVDGVRCAIGNVKLMEREGLTVPAAPRSVGTILHIARAGEYLGYIEMADVCKDDAVEAIADLHAAGVTRTVMLTGDRRAAADAIASQLGIDEVHAQLLPQDKVTQVEALLASKASPKCNLAFVGDGINDAPVLMRSDVGIAMGALGSDAAIEAADIVLMDDKPSSIARAIRLARRTMRIVWQNIIFALGVKVGVLILAAFGLANLWLAVFADVGVCVIAILNAMRAMDVKRV